MKVNPDKFYLDSIHIEEKIKFFLISGNEETSIQNITEKIILILKKNSPKEVFKKNNTFVDLAEESSNINGLFVSSKILVYSQPKKLNLDVFKKDYENLYIIIQDSRIKNNSELKKWFDKSEEAYSISCYKINLDQKKTILSQHLTKNKIEMEKNAFWFFLENSDDRYGLFEAELKKLILLKDSIIYEKDIRALISNSHSDELEKIFFLLMGPSKKIILETNRIVSSSSNSYALLFQTKIFLNILLQSQNSSDINMFFPRHLFKYKQLFLNMFSKKTESNMIFALSLVKKTELMLRKNEALYLSIIQRFLLNMKKIF